MMSNRPPVRLTTRTLTVGTMGAVVVLAVGLVFNVAGLADAAAVVGNVGVVLLLLTPVAGLMATWVELRSARPTAAWLAVVVLGVLVVATLIALSTRA